MVVFKIQLKALHLWFSWKMWKSVWKSSKQRVNYTLRFLNLWKKFCGFTCAWAIIPSLAIILWSRTLTFRSHLRFHTQPRTKQQFFWIISVPSRPKFPYTLRPGGQGLELDISLFCQIIFPEGFWLTLKFANFVQQEKNQRQDNNASGTAHHNEEWPLRITFFFISVSRKDDTLVFLERGSFWTDTCYVLPTRLQATYAYLVLAGVCIQQQ